jgi:hypothetical protein
MYGAGKECIQKFGGETWRKKDNLEGAGGRYEDNIKMGFKEFR